MNYADVENLHILTGFNFNEYHKYAPLFYCRYNLCSIRSILNSALSREALLENDPACSLIEVRIAKEESRMPVAVLAVTVIYSALCGVHTGTKTGAIHRKNHKVCKIREQPKQEKWISDKNSKFSYDDQADYKLDSGVMKFILMWKEHGYSWPESQYMCQQYINSKIK